MHYITNIVFFSRIFCEWNFSWCVVSVQGLLMTFLVSFQHFVRRLLNDFLPKKNTEKRKEVVCVNYARRRDLIVVVELEWKTERKNEKTCSWSDRGVKARNDYCRNRQFTASLIIIHQFSPMIFWLCILFPQFRPIVAYLDWQLDLPTLIQIRCNSSSHWARSKRTWEQVEKCV